MNTLFSISTPLFQAELIVKIEIIERSPQQWDVEVFYFMFLNKNFDVMVPAEIPLLNQSPGTS